MKHGQDARATLAADGRTTRWAARGWALIVLGVVLGMVPSVADAGRMGEIRMTDGRVYRGEIIVRTPLRVVTWAEDELGIDSREDLAGYGSDGVFYRFYGRERRFGIDRVASIRLEPRPDLSSRELPPERYERRWDWKHPARHGDDRADISSEKVSVGDPFPVRELQAVITFASGEVLAGALTRVAVYLQAEDEPVARRFILRSRETGAPGETLDALRHVESIRFREPGATFAASRQIRFVEPRPDALTGVWAVTCETLTPLTPRPVTGAEDTVEVSGALGEGVFLAMLKDGVYRVGWQDNADPAVYALARDHVARLRDYYNERELLGVLQLDGTRDVLTLVRLRRHVPDTSPRELQPERFGLAADASLEFFRVAVWRWRLDADSGRMLLSERGSFFRKQLPEKGMPTPPVQTCEALWLDEADGKSAPIVIGREKADEK